MKGIVKMRKIINKKILSIIFEEILLIFLILSFFQISCDKKEGYSINYFYLADSLKVLEDSKTPYLFRPKAPVFCTDGRMFISDVGNNRIIFLNNKMKLINEFGAKGQGPKEFIEATKMDIKKDKLFILDKGNNKISIYDFNGNFMNSIRTTFTISDMSVNSQGNIILSSTSLDKIIHILDINGVEINSFGKLVPNEDIYLSRLLSVAYIETDEDDNIYLAFIQSPFIRKYNSSGSLLYERNLQDYTELKQIYNMAWDEKKKNPSKKYSIRHICLGTHFINDNFYVGFIGVIPFGNTFYSFNKDGNLNQIIRISKGDQPIETLPDSWDFSLKNSKELWLAESRNHRLLIYKYEGKQND